MEEMKVERSKLEKEKQEIIANQKHLESQQLEMKKDIDDLVGLSMKLKDQREQFFKERERFISCVEKQKDCIECKQRISESILSDLQSLQVNKADTFTLPRIDVANSGSLASGMTTSWLQKCSSKIFIFSAEKKNAKNGTELVDAQEKLVDFGEIPEYILSSEDEPEVNTTLFRKAIVGGATENNDSLGGLEDNIHNEENRGESGYVEKKASRVGRKRNRKCTSEQDPDEDSDIVANWDHRNRPKITSLIDNVGAFSNPSKRDGVENGVPDSNLQPGPSTSFANGNHPEYSQADEFLKIHSLI